MKLKKLLEELFNIFPAERNRKIKIYNLTSKDEFIKYIEGSYKYSLKFIYVLSTNKFYYFDGEVYHEEIYDKYFNNLKTIIGYCDLVDDKYITISDERELTSNNIRPITRIDKEKVIKKLESLNIEVVGSSRYGNKSEIGRLKRLGIIS